jgi:hypothetical protein
VRFSTAFASALWQAVAYVFCLLTGSASRFFHENPSGRGKTSHDPLCLVTHGLELIRVFDLVVAPRARTASHFMSLRESWGKLHESWKYVYDI